MPSANSVTVSVGLRVPNSGRRARDARRSLQRFLRRLRIRGVEVGVLLVADAEMAQLNGRWRNKRQPTDVLAFAAAASPPAAVVQALHFLGELVVSVETARRCARLYGHTLAQEIDVYLAHGLLHLLGHDHHARMDARRMARAEQRLLAVDGLVAGRQPPTLAPRQPRRTPRRR